MDILGMFGIIGSGSSSVSPIPAAAGLTLLLGKRVTADNVALSRNQHATIEGVCVVVGVSLYDSTFRLTVVDHRGKIHVNREAWYFYVEENQG
jgi:hypothetical protein